MQNCNQDVHFKSTAVYKIHGKVNFLRNFVYKAKFLFHIVNIAISVAGQTILAKVEILYPSLSNNFNKESHLKYCIFHIFTHTIIHVCSLYTFAIFSIVNYVSY
jgi:hypothetical protein